MLYATYTYNYTIYTVSPQIPPQSPPVDDLDSSDDVIFSRRPTGHRGE